MHVNRVNKRITRGKTDYLHDVLKRHCHIYDHVGIRTRARSLKM